MGIDHHQDVCRQEAYWVRGQRLGELSLWPLALGATASFVTSKNGITIESMCITVPWKRHIRFRKEALRGEHDPANHRAPSPKPCGVKRRWWSWRELTSVQQCVLRIWEAKAAPSIHPTTAVLLSPANAVESTCSRLRIYAGSKHSKHLEQPKLQLLSAIAAVFCAVAFL